MVTITAANGMTALDFDTKLAALWEALARANDEATRYMQAMHRALGDRERGYGRDRHWGMTNKNVVGTFRERGDAALPPGTGALVAYGDAKPRTYATALDELQARVVAISGIETEITGMDAIYDQAPWQRFFLCCANGGHIHASWRGLPACNLDANSLVSWRPGLSGHTIADAVADLGERLCTHCFPDAPAEWKEGELRETREARAERDAHRAGLAAAKAAKTLTTGRDGEQFRSRETRDMITTVAGCEKLIRDAAEQAVQVEYYRSPATIAGWPHDIEFLARLTQNAIGSLAKMQADAYEAEYVLLTREGAHPGWGRTAAQIAKIRANKDRAARKAWKI
jgi:hypothetical protein